MRAVHRALKPTGSFYLAIGDEYAADLCVIARRKIGFHLRNWIIWHYTFGQQTKKKFAKSHTHILYFTKRSRNGMNFTFNADAVRVASARQTTYGDARANPKGKLPDDTWFLRPQEAAPHAISSSRGVRHVERQPRLRHVQGARRLARLPDADRRAQPHHHGQQQPRRRRARPVQRLRHDGRRRRAAGRKYVGIDQSAEYVDYARKRLEHALAASNNHVNGNGNGTALTQQEMIADPKRASKVMTATDAFGRKHGFRRGPRRRKTQNA